MCDRCDCDRAPQQLIYGYSTRVERRLKFQGKPKEAMVEAVGMPLRDTTFFGVELEVEVRRTSGVEDAAKATLDGLGRDFVMLKSDASISRGFEIVSAPATLEFHRSRWVPFLENKPKAIVGWETQTCGMHVHISRPKGVRRGGRTDLGSLHLGKMLVFMNNPEHRQEIVAIAGRQSHWGKFGQKNLKDGLAREYTDRYSAVNTNNQNTLEIRIFRSTTSPAGFMRNLEFCHAMFYFTRDSSARELGWAAFVAYVKENRGTYPALTEFIEEKIESDDAYTKRIAVIERRGLNPDAAAFSRIKGDARKERIQRRLERAAADRPSTAIDAMTDAVAELLATR